MPAFARTIGIDYSGAETPTASLKGLRVYLTDGDGLPVEVLPPPSPRKYWTRKGIAEWLVERLADDAPTLVGIDHGFSFPLRYFEMHGLLPDWPRFLDDFQRHWPTDEDHTYVEFVHDGIAGNGAARMGNARWRRLTEERVGGAKSVFHFDVQGSVAKSTHAGIPWLRFIRQRLGARVHFWPFDGWAFRPGNPRLPRSIRPCGHATSPMRAAPATSTTPSAPPPGSRAPIVMAVLLHSSTPIYRRSSAHWLRWRAGSSAPLTQTLAQ
jgi:hypothetical protein